MHKLPPKAGQPPPDLRSFFAQWLNSTGVPDFTLEYVVYRTHQGFRVVVRSSSPSTPSTCPSTAHRYRKATPNKTIDVIGTNPNSRGNLRRPKPGGIKIDPNNVILKGSSTLRARCHRRGEELAEQGRYYDAIGHISALFLSSQSPARPFPHGEAFFYQKNYQAAANAFRDALQTVPEAAENGPKSGATSISARSLTCSASARAPVNEYSKAKQTNDDTGSAQQVAEQFLKKAYTKAASPPPHRYRRGARRSSRSAASSQPRPPVLKKRTDPAQLIRSRFRQLARSIATMERKERARDELDVIPCLLKVVASTGAMQREAPPGAAGSRLQRTSACSAVLPIASNCQTK